MENLIAQRRLRFSGAGQHISNNAREQGTASSKGDKKSQNWLGRQLSRQTSHYDYEFEDDEFPTAIAATAFAIYSLEEDANSQQRKERSEGFRIPTTRKQDHPKSVDQASMRKNDRAPSSIRAAAPLATGSSGRRISSSVETKADAWEKAEMAKILRRYEMTNSTILTWENEKKLTAKRQMERKKAEVEQISKRNSQHYQGKVARIEDIAGRAREEAEKKRKNEESKVKNKAKKIRSTGKLPAPVCCCCF